MSAPLADPGFSEAARAWFDATFPAPTPVQEQGWARIAARQHTLLLAPTGSGKTLAAFYACIDRLGTEMAETRARGDAWKAGVRVLYVSPLKALVYDIERNLRAPLIGVQRAAERAGVPFVAPRVAVRTGDTSQKERRQQSRDPAEILVTTPESLYLILGSQQRETLRTVDTVILDEIHALAPTKRGAHLALSLERLSRGVHGDDPQRIGLSATARPLEEVARFLGGPRPVEIVDTSTKPHLDLRISVPVPDMTRPGEFQAAEPPGVAALREERRREEEAAAETEEGLLPTAPDDGGSMLAQILAKSGDEADTSLWPAIYPQLLEGILSHRSAIVFVNSRGLCERLARRLNELAGEDLVRSHHGSLAHEERKNIEEALKSGALRAIVATSSLELGIDMGAVDLVMMVESPGAVSRGLQRVGRAGHQVGVASRGLLFPKHRGDLLEAVVVSRGMRGGEVEALAIPSSPLDVLSQQVVAMAASEPLAVDDIEEMMRRTASFRDTSREQLEGVLDMLAGRYPSTDFAELKPRVLWDRTEDKIEARRGAGRIAIASGGTIPDRGLYGVHLGDGGPRVGELDEEMVHETRAGETVTLGASTWRVLEITRDRVLVEPAPGEVGKLPFWRGEGPGRPLELGQAVGRFTRELAERCRGETPADLHGGRAKAESWLVDDFALDEWAARNLVDYLVEQHEATGALPTDRAVTLERFRDELGDWRLCLLTPFGARLHAPWALAIEARLSREAGYEVQTLWSDDGIVLRFADAEELPPREVLFPEPEDLEELVIEQLERSALFSGHFRENAGRALLLPRRRPGQRTPLWSQRLRAQNLLAVARQFPAFPIMLETYRSCLQDVFDLTGLQHLLRDVRSRKVRVDEVETPTASPFARSLVFAYTATYLYQGDTPVAERRAQALTLDRETLRDLLGHEELRELLDASVIAETEDELQGRAEERRARHADALHDLLRRVGDLAEDEIAERCDGDATDWLESLVAGRRAIRIRIAGEERVVAAEDAALYRDALGSAPPPGLPQAFLEASADPLGQLVTRYARTHGPFTTRQLADRLGLLPAQLDATLASQERCGRLLAGEFHPEGRVREWCDAEIMRRLRRRTLARLRGEVAPVESVTLGRFLPEWHGVGEEGPPEARLDEALQQLEGVALPFSELERAVLPARVPGFDPRMLDERGALGQWVWVGRGALGDKDGRVALYRRERIALLAEPPELPEELGPLHRAVLDHLGERGACFVSELLVATGSPPQKELLDALFDLVWAGLVTNDTFAPLRALSARTPGASARRNRPRRPSTIRPGRAPSLAAGRWSRVQDLLAGAPDATRRTHARSLLLLERHGVVSRDVLAVEDAPGGFSSLYAVYRAMEESGKIRRGHFVEGYSGAQFAFAGAVDQLRSARVEADPPVVHVLAATDPAQPYGALLPWPEARSSEARPRRSAGARVVLVNGELALYLDRAGLRAWTFASLLPEHEARNDALAARALRSLFRERSRTGLRLEQIDAEPATRSARAVAFLEAGFRTGYKGLELDRTVGEPA
ncbi:MAG: DEAD/DEAH box helicase [Myxococcota bacterium]|nr:DEAD/DEAH box helicase [Myxococcota bacterium]